MDLIYMEIREINLRENKSKNLSSDIKQGSCFYCVIY